MNIITLKKNWDGLDLPYIQKKFISSLTSDITSLVNFKDIEKVLNPSLSKPHPTAAELNASALSFDIKNMLSKQDLYLTPKSDVKDFVKYSPSINYGKKWLFILIGDEMVRIPGLTTRNICYQLINVN